MGEWFWDGLVIDPSTKTRALQQTFTLLNDMVKYIPVTDAKRAYNYPRPSLNTEYGDAFDRSVHESNDLKGLAPALGIKRASDWTDPYRGFEHGAGYAEMIPDNSQSFPSGHTMAFYASGLTLAAMVPELSTQIAARAAEGGNDRIVLGVHYPLDIIGGRIVGTASAAGRLGDDQFYQARFLPAQQELRTYLTKRGRAAGYGDTFAQIVARTKAATTDGYKSGFTDEVSMDPVTDVPSAVTAFTRRMTYGFAAVGRTGQQPRVPAGAEALLRTVFPTLDGKQRTAVLARTEIDSGYPLDSTSDGWQRLNLAAAFSSKVTVSDSGAVIKVEPGRRAEVVVQHDPTIASVRVTAQPTVGVYHAGQEFDPAGLVVTARMSDGTERRLSADEYVLMGFNANATNGPQIITVAVRDERTMTASFTVTITGRAVPDKPTTPAAAPSHAECFLRGKLKEGLIVVV
jgi:hypothetical protein